VSWSKEGLERFNELLAEVVEDRKSDTGKAFDEKFKANMEEAYGRRKRKRKKKVARRETVEVVNMLDELMGEGTMDGEEVEGGADDGDDN
jgi:Txe/YoeB family toxin of Txe-Axe toxin-antitoxin module